MSETSHRLLRASAGTGKTFLSMAFLQQVEARHLCWTVVSPTHKSVGVLRSHLALSGQHGPPSRALPAS